MENDIVCKKASKFYKDSEEHQEKADFDFTLIEIREAEAKRHKLETRNKSSKSEFITSYNLK